jgi:chromosome segregation ATPase
MACEREKKAVNEVDRNRKENEKDLKDARKEPNRINKEILQIRRRITSLERTSGNEAEIRELKANIEALNTEKAPLIERSAHLAKEDRRLTQLLQELEGALSRCLNGEPPEEEPAEGGSTGNRDGGGSWFPP